MSPLPSAAPEFLERYVELYKHLHEHPEPSMLEVETAALIEDALESLGGIEVFRCGGTGVVGVIENGEGPTVAFRADIDGLPIPEQTGLPYASTQTKTLGDGTTAPMMHGCGHDAHIASALAAIELLVTNRDTWSGTVVCIFQPGEETAAGATAMVEDGLWDRAPKPDVVLGQHIGPFAAGTVRGRAGHVMSLADAWQVTVRGRGAHGSQPENSVDPIVSAAYMITRLQAVVSRHTSPLESVVLTIGTIHAGLKENIIPDDAVFTVNVRTPSSEVRERVLTDIRRIIESEAAAAGGDTPLIEELYRFPRNHNDPAEFERVASALSNALGAENAELDFPRAMASEDFGHLGDSIDVPTVYWWFGAFEPGEFAAMEGPIHGNHSPRFAPHPETAIPGGITAALAAIYAYVGT